ncbi:GPH family glycoside/pentoside/hexuronide:cation symporter [Sphingomonas vulcanisoli]|uniref:GPH family glycoside/pentoside/hexuronide:cation symporter n=1 Tax=Sphingomonas vulcanisoli TaxID=1658060 RepID=A0ABX0TSK5_9SPHN|nr:MFS transporter [Sphingomonas vulcanisoli]NIJ08503.1 GPH family glycoside/pentoside/hexuronide:cation symporter [Sphingomonas vulcanisoli]
MATRAEPAPAAPGLGLGGQVGYGAGQVAGQVFRDVPSLLLLFFMTTVLGIAPAIAGAAIFVPKLVWGVGCDLTVGVLSDRWQRKVARRWWLLGGAIGAPLAMIALFHVPQASTGVRVAYVAGVFSLYMAVFASFSVPYLAIAGELTANPGQRNVLMAWRLVFTSVGVLTAGALAPGIIQASGGGQNGYETMALVLAVICPVALLIAFLSIGKGLPPAPQAPRVRLSFGEAAAVLARPRFAVLLGANLLQLAGSGMGYAAMLYFLSYNMGRADAFQLIGALVVMVCVGIVVAQPLWVWAAARIGKKRSYLIGTAIYAVTYAIWAFAAHWGTAAAYALAFIAAVGNSGWAMLGFSMVSDIASEDERHAGLYSAAWIATDKIAFALGGTLLTGLLLSGFGFDSARAVAGLPQTPLALVGVAAAFGLAPALFNLAGGLIFWRWGREG